MGLVCALSACVMASNAWARRARPATTTPVAPAVTPPATGCDSADQQRGRALRDQGEDQQAYELFRAVYEREHLACAQARMGLALRALGRWTDALDAIEAALAHADDPWVAAARATLNNEVTEIRTHVGELNVTLTEPVAGAKLAVNGGAEQSLPLSAPVRTNAGSAVIQVSAPGYVAIQRTVNVTAGTRTVEAVTLVRGLGVETPTSSGPTRTPRAGTEPQRDDTQPTPSPPRAGGVSAPGVALSAVGGAIAITGGVFYGLAFSSYERYSNSDACRTFESSPETLCMSDRTDATLFRRIAIPSLAVGAAALGVGIVLLATHKNPGSERPNALSLTCLPSLDVPGALCAGRF